MKKFKKYFPIILCISVFLIILSSSSNMNLKSSEITNFNEIESLAKKESYSTFDDLLKKDKIDAVYAEFTDAEYGNTFFYLKKEDKTIYMTENPQYEGFKRDILETGTNVYTKAKIFEYANKIPAGKTDYETIFSLLINIFFIVFMFAMISNIGGMNMFNNNTTYTLTNSRDELEKNKNTKDNKKDIQDNTQDNMEEDENKEDNANSFACVGGLKEVKEDLTSVVDFIKNPKKYNERDAKLPRGVLLVGPPGTGKTLLAKVIAQETNLPFLYANGSDFVEMYVGRGAARIRELFKEARKQAPCVVFIDEIDTLCGKRETHGEHSEDRKTLTALLAEMDGFEDMPNILVMAATNRIEDIDKAALRPGRFTEIFHVPIPETMEERMEVINIYAKNKKFSEDVDLKTFAHEMIGRSPAEIEAVLNEAAIISVQKGLEYINKDCLETAFYKRVMQGHQKDNKETNPIDLKTIAYHEAGHTLVAKLHGQSVVKVTIIPSTSGAGGFTSTQPPDRKLYSKTMLMNKVKEFYGGKVAEYLLYNKDWDSTTGGCSNDLMQATSILKDMVEVYGMSENKLVNMNVLSNELTKESSDFVFQMSNKLLQETIQELEDNYDKLEALANALLEHETLYEADIDKIIGVKKEENITI